MKKVCCPKYVIRANQWVVTTQTSDDKKGGISQIQNWFPTEAEALEYYTKQQETI